MAWQHASPVPAHSFLALPDKPSRPDCARFVTWFTCHEKNLVICDLHHILTDRASA
jgi:hypothetical protein